MGISNGMFNYCLQSHYVPCANTYLQIGMGFVKGWHSMVALRIILGIFEAGFFPGSVYLLRYVINLHHWLELSWPVMPTA
jgi:hypothetical protein